MLLKKSKLVGAEVEMGQRPGLLFLLNLCKLLVYCLVLGTPCGYSRNVEILWFVRVQCRGENCEARRMFVNGEFIGTDWD